MGIKNNIDGISIDKDVVSYVGSVTQPKPKLFPLPEFSSAANLSVSLGFGNGSSGSGSQDLVIIEKELEDSLVRISFKVQVKEVWSGTLSA
jgi:hypothetical protein